MCGRNPVSCCLFVVVSVVALASCTSKSAIDHVNDGLGVEDDDPELAIRHCTTAIEKDSKLSLAFTLRGAAWHDLGDNSAAMKDLDRAIEIAGDVEPLAYFHRGIVWRTLGNYRRAVEDHTRAIELEPRSATYAQRASDWFLLEEWRKALEDYQRAVELEPKNDLAQIGLAGMYANSKDHSLRDGEAAVRHATIACELTDFHLPQYILILAESYETAGNTKRAEEYRTRAKEVARQITSR